MLLVLKSKKKSYKKMKLFLRELGRQLRQKNCKFYVSSFEDVEVFLERGRTKLLIEGKSPKKWTSIYVRKVGKYRGLAHILASLAKTQKINFIDKYHEQAKDSSDAAKIIQMFCLGSTGISIPKTYYAATYSDPQIKNALKYLGLPIVIKECNTSQGVGVFLAKTAASLKKIVRKRLAQNERAEIFLQEFIPNSFEYRLLVTGNKIAVAEKKIRQKKGEWRNNVFLGAREEFIDPSKVKWSLLKEALLAAKETGVQVAGVDIVEGKNGRPVIFEVNACPAFTVNPRVSNEVEKLAEYLSKCEKI